MQIKRFLNENRCLDYKSIYEINFIKYFVKIKICATFVKKNKMEYTAKQIFLKTLTVAKYTIF